MASCRLCGHEFDESKEELIECKCGCGGDKVLCPNCGYEVRVTSGVAKRPVKEEDAGILGKFISKFRMDS